MDKISVVISSYNRFDNLLETIESVKEQSYSNLEIIVVNNNSTQNKYSEYDWENNDIKIINLDKKETNGYVRNKGIEISSGKFVAFCDDKTIWCTNKLELQIKNMIETGCKMSSTDGLIGKGKFNTSETYKKYNSEHYYEILQNIFKRKESNLLDNGFPKIWDINFLKIHNCMISTSVIIDKEILDKINNFEDTDSNYDYDCWLKSLDHTDSVYIEEICFYLDTDN